MSSRSLATTGNESADASRLVGRLAPRLARTEANPMSRRTSESQTLYVVDSEAGCVLSAPVPVWPDGCWYRIAE